MRRSAMSKEEAETSVSAAVTDGSEEKKKDTGPFAEGEKVLAYHGPLIYEAKVVRDAAQASFLIRCFCCDLLLILRIPLLEL